MQEQHSQLTITFKLVITGLTSLFLVALSTVNVQFQGPFVPILNCGSSRPGYSLVIMSLTSPPGVWYL